MTLVSGALVTILAFAGQQNAFGPTRAAVVNVGVVSERYLKTADLEAQFEQQRIKLNEQRTALQGRIDTTRQSLQEELKPGTTEFNERRKQLALLEAEMQWFMESEGQRIEASLAQSLRSIFDDIRSAVQEVALERRIELVVSADQLPPEAPATTAQARQQILLQKVLYFHPQVDITDDVVARLNARHKAQSGPRRP